MMPQQDGSGNFVIATGRTTTVRDTCEPVFQHVGLSSANHLIDDEKLLRPAEVEVLLGNPAETDASFGWKAEIALDTKI